MKNNQDRKSNTANFDARLLAETGNSCPLCGKRLLGEKSGRSVKLYDIAHIYPHSPTQEQLLVLQNAPMVEDKESFENKIALCKDCHNRQDFHTQKEEYMRLYNIKQRLIKQTKALDEASTVFIENEIEEVLRRLKDADIKELVPLSYDVISVDKKITKENGLLLNDVREKIVQYFLFIQEMLRNIDNMGSQKSKIMASEIRTCFLKMNDKGLSQEEVFSALVKWLYSKTQSQSEIACGIIVAYFVQDCEVFDVIAQ
jgi:cytochrome c553